MTCEAHKDMVCSPCCMFAYSRQRSVIYLQPDPGTPVQAASNALSLLFGRLKQATG